MSAADIKAAAQDALAKEAVDGAIAAGTTSTESKQLSTADLLALAQQSQMAEAATQNTKTGEFLADPLQENQAAAAQPIRIEDLSDVELEQALSKRQAARRQAALLTQAMAAGRGKTYYTRIPNSTFIAQKKDETGKFIIGRTVTVQFHGTTLYVEDLEIIEQLDEVANVGGSLIYTKEALAHAPQADNEAFSQVRERAAEVVQQMAAAGIRA